MEKLRALALRSGGVVTAAAAKEAGITRAQLRTLLENGSWMRLQRGVFAETAVVEHCRAAGDRASHAFDTVARLAGAGSDRFAVEHSAAALLNLQTLTDPVGRVAVGTAKHGTGGAAGAGTPPRSTHGFRGDSSRTLVSHVPPEQLITVATVPLTAAGRTAVDLARTCDLRAAVVALDSAARQFGVTEAELREVAALQDGWPCARRTAQALDLMDERSESVPETLGRLALRFCERPLPSVRCQAWVGDGIAEWRVDLLLPELWVVGEADGLVKYAEPRALVEEKRRQERLEELGFTVVRWEYGDAAHRPRSLARRFDAAIDRAAAWTGPRLGRVFPDPSWWLADRTRKVAARTAADEAWWLAGCPGFPG